MAWFSKYLSRLLSAIIGGAFGLIVGIVIGLRILGLPLAPGYAIEMRYLAVDQLADAHIVSAREVARDVATSAVIPAFLSTGVASSTWNVVWLGDSYCLLIASAPVQASVTSCIEAAKGELAQAVEAHNTSLESYTLCDVDPSSEITCKATEVLIDRLASTVLVVTGAGALFGLVVWHLSRMHREEDKQL